MIYSVQTHTHDGIRHRVCSNMTLHRLFKEFAEFAARKV